MYDFGNAVQDLKLGWYQSVGELDVYRDPDSTLFEFPSTYHQVETSAGKLKAVT